jgi:hypothetical protein
MEPEEAVKCHVARGQRELLIIWKGQPAVVTSWINLEEFKQLFLKFQLVNELILHGGCNTLGF